MNLTKSLDPYIWEAQNLDLKPLLGSALFYDMMENLTVQKYIDLLSGKVYEYRENNIYFNGLKPSLVYFAYARYINNKNSIDTPYGLVQKRNPDSNQSPEKEIARRVSQAKSAAATFFNEVAQFLNSNVADYPLWQNTERVRKNGGIRISGVGGNSKSNDYDCEDIKC